MKQLTILGIVLILFALCILYLSSLQFESTVSNNTIQTVIIAPHNSIAVPLRLSNTTIVGLFYYSNGSSISYYFVNQSVFSQISPYLDSNTLLNATRRFEGNGVYQILYNSSAGTFPYQNQSGPVPPSYFYNGSAIFASGTYYDIFQNSGGANTTVYYSLIQKLQVSINNSLVATTAYGLSGAIIFLVGIILIGYSVIVEKGAQEKEAVPKGDVDALYAKYEPKHSPKAHKRRTKKRARSRQINSI